MFKIFAHRPGSTFEQQFDNWKSANDKAKWLADNGFTVEITPTHTRS